MFRFVQKCFKYTNTSFFTFPKPEEKNLKIIIGSSYWYFGRGALYRTKISRLRSHFCSSIRTSWQEVPIHMVTLLVNPFSKGIFILHSLFYISIKVEPYRLNNPAQCYNCQHFCHSSLYCEFPPRCLKCAGDHSTRLQKAYRRGTKMHNLSRLTYIKLLTLHYKHNRLH